MEMMAAIAAFENLEGRLGPVDVYTDSTYLIQGITQWIWGWRKRDWKTSEGKDVANADLWKRLHALVLKRGKGNSIRWHYVRGHAGTPGNERVDEIAVAFSQRKRVELFHGPLLKYPVAIHDLPEDTALPERKPESQEKKAAYSYVSLVNGVARRHSTWKECESIVKGRPGAKFKKALSAADEEQILRSWGVDPSRVR